MSVSEKVPDLTERYLRHDFAELVTPLEEGEISQEWLSVIQCRADDIDSGKVKLIDGESALKKLITL